MGDAFKVWYVVASGNVGEPLTEANTSAPMDDCGDACEVARMAAIMTVEPTRVVKVTEIAFYPAPTTVPP